MITLISVCLCAPTFHRLPQSNQFCSVVADFKDKGCGILSVQIFKSGWVFLRGSAQHLLAMHVSRNVHVVIMIPSMWVVAYWRACTKMTLCVCFWCNRSMFILFH